MLPTLLRRAPLARWHAGALACALGSAGGCDAPAPVPREPPAPIAPPVGPGGGGEFDALLDTVTRFVLAAAGSSSPEAHELLCPATRAAISLDVFTASVRGHPYLVEATSVERGPGRASHSRGLSVYDVRIEGPAGPAAGSFYLAKRDARWCIDGAIVAGIPVIALPSQPAGSVAGAATGAR